MMRCEFILAGSFFILAGERSGMVCAESEVANVRSHNPFFPRLRSGHRLVLEPSPQKQFLSNPDNHR